MKRLAGISVLLAVVVGGCSATRITSTTGPVTLILDDQIKITAVCAAMMERSTAQSSAWPRPDGCVTMMMARGRPIDAVIFCPAWPLESLARCVSHEAAHLLGWRHE